MAANMYAQAVRKVSPDEDFSVIFPQLLAGFFGDSEESNPPSDNHCILQIDDEEVSHFKISYWKTSLRQMAQIIAAGPVAVLKYSALLMRCEKQTGITASQISMADTPPREYIELLIQQYEKSGQLKQGIQNPNRFVYPPIPSEDSANESKVATESTPTSAPKVQTASAPVIKTPYELFLESQNAGSPSKAQAVAANKGNDEARRQRVQAENEKRQIEKNREEEARKQIKERLENDKRERAALEEQAKARRTAALANSQTPQYQQTESSTLQPPSSQQAASQNFPSNTSSSTLQPPSPSHSRNSAHVSPTNSAPISPGRHSVPESHEMPNGNGHKRSPLSDDSPFDNMYQENEEVEEEDPRVSGVITPESVLQIMRQQIKHNFFVLLNHNRQQSPGLTEEALYDLSWKHLMTLAVSQNPTYYPQILKMYQENKMMQPISAPSESKPLAGFVLGSATSSSSEAIPVVGEVLIMDPSQTTVTVRVTFPDGKPAKVSLHATHTVCQLYRHLATLSSFTDNHRLVLAGPGVQTEISMDMTVQESKIASQNLRLVPK